MGRGTRLLALSALLAAALLAPACGGGGGGGGPTAPTPIPTPTPSLTFTPASAGPGIVLAQGAATTASSLTVEVRAADVTGLYGAAFDLDYPATLLRFQSFAAGDFLGSGGTVSAQLVETASGHLVGGVTRLGSLPGVTGNGVLLRLVFSPVASGTGAFAFSRNTAFQPDGTALDLPWAAGTVTVVQ